MEVLKRWLLRGIFLALFLDAARGAWGGTGVVKNPYKRYATSYDGVVDAPKAIEESLPRDDLTTKGLNGKVLQVGTIVRAQWRRGETWYTGHVDLVNPDGTVDIQFDDGDYEWFVDPEFVKKLEGRKKRVVKADKPLARPELKHFMSNVDYALYGAKKTLPRRGELRFTRDKSGVGGGAGASLEELGASLDEEYLLEMSTDDKEMKWLVAASQAKANSTQCGRGHYGLGVVHMMEDRKAQAMKHFQRAADCGNPAAQRVLGLSFGGHHKAMTADWTGDGGETDTAASGPASPVDGGLTAKAVLHLYFAAMGGDAPAQLALGTKHLYGRGVPKKCTAGVVYLQAAAQAAVQSVEDRGQENIVESILLSEQISDGLSGRRARRRNGNGGGDGDGLQDDIVQYLSYAARNGDDSAQTSLGEIFYFGIRGIRRDAVKARKYFELSAKQGNERAMAMLGHMYTRGHGVEADNATALSWFEKSIEKDGKTAHAHLGMFYLFGLGVKRNVTKARVHFQHAANGGEAGAMHGLGVMRIKGLGVRRDYKKALQLFQRGSRQGHTLAQNKLAQMTLFGVGTSPSCEDAAKSFKSVAEKGPWSIKLQKAYRKFQQGDSHASLWLYQMLAGEGYSVAESNVAFLLEQEVVKSLAPLTQLKRAILRSQTLGNVGKAVGLVADEELPKGYLDQTAEHSVAFYSLAAEQGSSQAYVKMGDMFYFGFVGKDDKGLFDFKKAVSHYTMASKARNGQGRFNLGYMYEHGLGVKQDLHLAKRYYDETKSLDPEGLMPVYLVLFRMRLCKAWQSLSNRVFRTGSSTDKGGSEKKNVQKKLFSKDEAGLTIKAGSVVTARWKGRKHYYSGYVAQVNNDETVDIQYDDGDFEHNVQSRYIKRKLPNAVHPSYGKSLESDPEGKQGGTGMFRLPLLLNGDESVLVLAVTCAFVWVVYMTCVMIAIAID
jgi:SEL1 protein